MPDLELGAVFFAGLLTFVTPCVLPLIPIYLALLVGEAGSEASSGARARLALLGSTALFSLGMILVFVGMGLTATALGGVLTEHRTSLLLFGGLIILLFGLKLLGVLQIPWLDQDRRADDSRLRSRHRWLNALVMGIVFSLGWTPCVGPILGSVLTYTASQTADPWRGAAYLAAYGLGFTAPLLVLSLFADGARRFVQRASRALGVLGKISGALLVGVGLWLMLGATAVPEGKRAEAAVSSRAAVIVPPLGEPTKRPRMVQFTSSACSICRQMIPTVALIERDCDGRKVDVVKIDVEVPANRELATSYRVRGVPTFVFLTTEGKEVARLVGYQTIGSLRQALSALVGEQCTGVGGLPEPPPCGSGPGAQCDQQAGDEAGKDLFEP